MAAMGISAPCSVRVSAPSVLPARSAPAAALGQTVAFRQQRVMRDVRMSATYKVKLITPTGEVEIEAPDDVYLLDHCEEVGITSLPYSCRAGSCSTCVGKLVSGTVDQTDNNFLDDEQIAAGWVLTCIAYPRSDDVVIQTEMEDAMNEA